MYCSRKERLVASCLSALGKCDLREIMVGVDSFAVGTKLPKRLSRMQAI